MDAIRKTYLQRISNSLYDAKCKIDAALEDANSTERKCLDTEHLAKLERLSTAIAEIDEEVNKVINEN